MSDELPNIPYTPFDQLPALDFGTMRRTLADLMTAMGNLLDRSLPKEYAKNEALRTFLVGTIKITESTYKTVLHLCVDRPADSESDLEFSISVPLMTRSILDSLFTVVFVLEDPVTRLQWFNKSGWREVWEETARYKGKYSMDPAWKDHFAVKDAWLTYGRQGWGITDEEAESPKKIAWWPTPGRMAQHMTSKERKSYLEYLTDWFYHYLSADSHLTYPGFARRSMLFFASESMRSDVMRKYRSDYVSTTIVMVLALLSEIECKFHFGRAERLQYVWRILNEFSGISKDLYELRYASRLSSESASR